MKKAQKALCLFKRFGAAALALSLFGCSQTGAPSQSLPASSAVLSEEAPQSQGHADERG